MINMEKTFIIGGMHCAACAAGIEKYIGRQNGVDSVSVNLATARMDISYDDSLIDVPAIIAGVEKLSYTAREYIPASTVLKEDESEKIKAQKNARNRLVLAIVFSIPLLYISMGHMLGAPLPVFADPEHNPTGFAGAQFILAIPILWAGRQFFISGARSAVNGHPNMDTLVALGSSASFIYGVYALAKIAGGDVSYAHSLFFESSAIVLTLVMLGKYLEAKSSGRTGEAIKKLMQLTPDTALVERAGQSMEIPADELAIGDTVTVLPGGRFPCDGVVKTGISTADLSMLTGESVPVTIEPGSDVVGGSINGEGRIVFSATGIGPDTALGHIVALVENAQGKKAPIAKLADTVAGYFVPAVLGIAVLTAIVWAIVGKSLDFVLNASISVLVIACPCSLGLATPTAIMSGTGRGAELGILFKSGEALQATASVDTVALDKTGTVTEGRPVLHSIETAPGVDSDELLCLCAAAEAGSGHPVAKAITDFTGTLKIRLPEADSVNSIPGKGVEAAVAGKNVLIGSRALMEERGIVCFELDSAAEIQSRAGCMLMFAAVDGRAAGLFSAVDAVKPDSRDAVAKMHGMGMKVIMLTGDNAFAAEAIASEALIDEVCSGVLPEGKAGAVEALAAGGHVTAMIGDGINDAPALTAAQVGIAIGTGTDVAIESADVVLMGGELGSAVTAFRLARAVMKNIKQNLFWAFLYNCCGIPFAAGVVYALGGPLLNPMIAGAAMALSSVSVVTNALRLRHFKP